MSVNDLMNEDLTPFLNAIFVGLIIGGIIAAIIVASHKKWIDESPAITMKGKIIAIQPGPRNTMIRHELIFESQDGTRVKLFSFIKDSDTLIVGDSGIVTYQKDRLVRFQKNTNEQ